MYFQRVGHANKQKYSRTLKYIINETQTNNGKNIIQNTSHNKNK
jgi:hypothetical protein